MTATAPVRTPRADSESGPADLDRTRARRTLPLAVRVRRRLPIWSMMTLSLIGLAVFFAYPLIANVVYSVTNYRLLGGTRFVGLHNYIYMFTKDRQIGTAALNTLWFVVIMTPIKIVCSLALALLLTRRKSGTGFWRTLFYFPALISPVASVVAFVFMLNPGSGPINTILRSIGIEGPLWFSDPKLSKPSLLLLSIWIMGDVLVIFLASMLDVPKDLYEAAQLDGADGPQQFWHITLPTISPVIFFSLITGLIAALQYFTEAAVASSIASGKTGVSEGVGALMGYPNNSLLTYAQWIYSMGWSGFHLGYAAAMSVVLFVVAAVMIAILLRFSNFGKEGDQR